MPRRSSKGYKVTEYMNEETIIERCRNGEIGAFKLIYEEYQQPLLLTALRMLDHREDAEDAVHATFMKLFKKIDTFRFESKFSTFLFRIHVNVCLDRLKRRKRIVALPVEAPRASGAPAHELRVTLERAIERLPGRQKACFVLFAVQQLPQEEIAQVLNLSLGGVKSNIHQAKRKLRKYLTDDVMREDHEL